MPRLGHLLFLLLAPLAIAQQPSRSSASSSASSASSSANPSSSQSSGTSAANVTSIVTSVPVTRASVSAGNTIQITAFTPTTIFSTIAPTNTSTTAPPPANTTAANATTPSGPVLDTRVDPGFGVLGAILVLTGLPSAFLGHKNRWSSFFLTGFYTLALVCLALILKFGVLVAVHPPNQTLRGLFVLACGVAGIAGGGVSIFFWQQAKYFIGAWGGFSVGLWVQCFRNGGLIRPIGFRWILYIGCGAVGFVLCTIPKLHYHVLIAGTAITGASAFMLGVDCFTTAGLKEFYVYNLGFTALFPKFSGMHFPVSQTMEIEIGLIAAVTLMGAAVQMRVLKVLKRKLKEINEEEQRREVLAEEKAVMRMEGVQHDLEEWEKEHGNLSSHGRHESTLSGVPLMKDIDEPSTPGGESTLVGHRIRTRSAASELAINEAPRPVSRFSQNPGLLPAMNLGLGIDSELPGNMIDESVRHVDPDLMRKEELLAEIQTIRKSIDALRSESGDSNSGDSRRPSMSLHSRTLSGDIAMAQVQASSSHLRPSRPPRDRVQSMDVLSAFDNNASQAASIGRPASTPLRDDDWDAYVRERKLFQPPSGASAPIAPTLVTPIPRPASAFMAVPNAVTEALARRKRRESAFELGGPSKPADEEGGRVSGSSSQTPPVDYLDAGPSHLKRSNSAGPVNILPPRHFTNAATKAEPATAPRTRTFEELVERHQQKIRTLQEPLSKQEREHTELAAARNRWERSKAVEKEAMARRHAEKEAALVKKGKEGKRPGAGAEVAGATAAAAGHSRSHTRTLSADRLAAAAGPGSGKRASTAKVQEWQRYQQEAEKEKEKDKDKDRGDRGREQQRRRPEQSAFPFPNSMPARNEPRKSRSGLPRDPPS
ncbi:hypothetical protein K439DRAFT_1039036 [Ramaria rubella]|nr:hypothetical protein K439DRAFT_1039036 [Ramaria rubella]